MAFLIYILFSATCCSSCLSYDSEYNDNDSSDVDEDKNMN